MATRVLYAVPRSPACQTVTLLLKMLKLDVKYQYVDLYEKKEQMEESFLKMNPTHTVPTLDDNGYYIWDSHAILGYLAHQYGNNDELYPKDPKQKGNVDKMLFWENGTIYRNLINVFHSIFGTGTASKDEALTKLKSDLGTFDRILSKSAYAAGEHLTIADFALLTTLSCLELLDVDLSEFSNVKRWIEQLKVEISSYEEVMPPALQDLKQFFAEKKAAMKQK